MTQAEKRHIDKGFEEVKGMIVILSGEVQEIHRGVYGDKKNGVKGLIDTDKEQHERIKSLEDTRKKGLWIGSGVLLALQGVWHLITSK